MTQELQETASTESIGGAAQPEGRADAGRRLQSILQRFPRGLSLGPEDLALIGWIHLYEQEAGIQGTSDARLKWLISEAVRRLGLDVQTLQPSQVVQRFMRMGVLRVALAEGNRRGCRLTSLGQGLARNFVDDIDYGSEHLSILLQYAFEEIRSAGKESGVPLLKYLKYIFLGAIREKIEYKLLAIEDDLEERKKTVKQTYAGNNEAAFDQAVQDVEYCRIALTELVDAVQESSACVRLEELLHERMGWNVEPDLYEALEQSLNFVYMLRGRVDAMLKDVVRFIHDCIAYRSLAFTVDLRDRMRRIQEKILSHALHNDLRAPILAAPRTPRMDLNWSRQERERPVLLDTEQLKTIEGFRPPELPPIEPRWKAPLLESAREEWTRLAEGGGSVELGGWLEEFMRKLPEVRESPWMAIWFLSQDWPKWSPAVAVEHRRGEWAPLGDEWMMEMIVIAPVGRSVE